MRFWYRYVGNEPTGATDPRGESALHVIAYKFGRRMPYAVGMELGAVLQLDHWGGYNVFGTGGNEIGVYFFPDTKELGIYQVHAGWIRGMNDGKSLEHTMEYSWFEGGVQAGGAAAIENAIYAGRGPASADSFAGVFCTGNLSVAIPGWPIGPGVSAYVGVPLPNGERWVSGTISVNLSPPLK